MMKRNNTKELICFAKKEKYDLSLLTRNNSILQSTKDSKYNCFLIL